MGSFSAGDSIKFNKGDEWNDALEITCDGLSGSVITFTSYGTGNDPIINGADVATGWSSAGYGNVYRKSFSATVEVLTEDDGVLTYMDWDTDVATTFASASAGSWARSGSTAYVWCTDDADPDTHTMEVGARTGSDQYGIYLKGSEYITIDGFKVQYTTGTAIHLQGNVANGGVTNVTVQNCTVYLTGQGGIRATENSASDHDYNNNITIDSNTVSYTAQHGIALQYGTSDSTVSNNTVHHCGWQGLSAPDGGHGISQWSNNSTYNCRDNIIENNTVYNIYQATDGAEGAGIQCDGRTQDCHVRYNKCYNCEGSGLYDNGIGGNRWYYNLSYGNGTGAVSGNFRGGISVSGMTSVYIYNNVFYDNTPVGIGIYGATSDASYVKNNICSENATYEARIGTYGTANLTLDYNCYYHSAGGNFMRWGTTTTTFAGWQTASSQDANSISENPDFIDAANGNFNLDAGSPCADKGTDVSLTSDYLGNTVPINTTPDIGAYEYVVLGQTAAGYVVTIPSVFVVAGTGFNMVTNGSFTSDTSSWSAVNNATLSSVAGGQSGNCLQIACDGSNNPGARQILSTGVVEGNPINLSFYVKEGTDASYNVMLYDKTNGYALIWAKTESEATSSWVQHTSGDQTVPSGCEEVQVTLRHSATAGDGTTVLFDEVACYTSTATSDVHLGATALTCSLGVPTVTVTSVVIPMGSGYHMGMNMFLN